MPEVVVRPKPSGVPPRGRGTRRPPARPSVRSRLERWLAIGAAALVLWKLRFVVVSLLFKLRFLVVGLGPLSALFDTLLSFGADARTFGWRLALAVLGTFVLHELGHAAALRWFGVPTTAAMLVPGVATFARSDAPPMSRRDEARAALAGPVCGTAAAGLLLLVGRHQGWPSLVAAAHVATWANLFLLVPVGRLDGSRAVVYLGRLQRSVLGVLAFASWLVIHEGLLLVFAAIVFFRAWRQGRADQQDEGRAGGLARSLVAATFAVLLVTLSLLLAAGGAGKL